MQASNAKPTAAAGGLRAQPPCRPRM